MKALRDAWRFSRTQVVSELSKRLLEAGKAVWEGQKEHWGERKPS